MLLNLAFTISRSNHNYLFDDLVRTNGCSNRLRRSLNKKVRETKKKRFPLPVLFVFADNAKSFLEYFYVVAVVFDHLEVFIKWTFPKSKPLILTVFFKWPEIITASFARYKYVLFKLQIPVRLLFFYFSKICHTFFNGQIRKVSNQLHRNLKAKKVERGTFKQGLLHWSNWLF